MSNDNKKEMQTIFVPGFIESMQNIPPEDREELMAEIEKAVVKLRDNPYLGTPLWGGRLRPLVVFWNWVKRTAWGCGLRW